MKSKTTVKMTDQVAGHENNGTWKSRGVKMQDMKMQDRKMQDIKMQDWKMLDAKVEGMKQLFTCSSFTRECQIATLHLM